MQFVHVHRTVLICSCLVHAKWSNSALLYKCCNVHSCYSKVACYQLPAHSEVSDCGRVQNVPKIITLNEHVPGTLDINTNKNSNLIDKSNRMNSKMANFGGKMTYFDVVEFWPLTHDESNNNEFAMRWQ